jgi:hypothetical protein
LPHAAAVVVYNMDTTLKRTIIYLAVSGALCLGLVLLLASGAMAAGRAQPVVELQDNSGSGVTQSSSFSGRKISGTDAGAKQPYKFQRQREGRYFSYVTANLTPSTGYTVELSFVEHDSQSAGRRIFNVYLQGKKVISRLDVYALVGRNAAYQRNIYAKSDSKGRITLKLRSDEAGCTGLATVSTVRIYRGTVSTVEIDASASRLNMDLPTRFTNGSGQNVYETALSKLGSRISLNLVPQKLGARFSTLGDGTGDLSDLVMGLHDGTRMRVLPFTDRYAVWEKMTLSQTMTSQTYKCSSSTVPFEVTVTFRAPFYPEEEKLSIAPFFYVDVKVTNKSGAPASPKFIFARPHSRDHSSNSFAALATADSTGYTCSSRYNYYDESYNNHGAKTAAEALAVPTADAADVTFKYSSADFANFAGDRLWGYTSPSGYPRTYSDYSKPVYSFYPRGYSGAVWSITNLAPGASDTKQFVLAGRVPDRVLRVSNSAYRDSTFGFKYRKHFGSVGAVVNYAFSQRDTGDGIETRSKFFDSVFSSDSYLRLPAGYAGSVRNLTAFSFQSFIMNTWWARSDSGREWFSVWEGSCCRYHSTVDVVYNDAWFYHYFWPGLLKMTMDEWVLYTRTNQQGVYMSHDMGVGDSATGQAYPNNMAVEENADFILVLYKYWKNTGDTAYMRKRFPTVRKLVDFLVNCDDNANGLPDLHTGNTVDQGSLAIQFGKDQSYLGVKCLAAYQASREMALNQASPDYAYAARCTGQVEAINQTLEYDMWLSDHFAVCFDGDVLAADREAYSIYASNGMLYLLGGTRSVGLTSANTEKMRTDLTNATTRTLKEYGCTHSSYDAGNQWVSQNLWRDQVAMMMGVRLNNTSPLALSGRYWSLEKYFAKNLWGTFWDVVTYPGGTAGGASVRTPDDVCAGSGSGGAGILPEAVTGRSAASQEAGASAYGQSLGYYPRGAASLGLIDAVAGLTLDAKNGSLYYAQTTYPLRVPVLARADWGNGDPSRRIPTLYFTSSGAPSKKNGNLLPSKVAPRRMKDVQNVQPSGHALSPNSDGVNETATVSYDLPLAANVSESVWEGSQLKASLGSRSRGKGRHTLTWDGRVKGAVVEDGVYTARIDARAGNNAYEVRPAGAPVYVNSSVPDLSTEWYLAEGYTGSNATGGEFEMYVLIQNPGAQAANVTATFMLPDGSTVERAYVVPAGSRFTITVDEILPVAEVSTRLTSDRPVAVERAMYFNQRKAGHDSIGVSRPSETWYLAEGYTDQSFDEYVLIQNPGDETADAKVTFMTPNAGNAVRDYKIKPHSRFTIHVDEIIPAQSVSTEIQSTRPVVVERAQYLNYMTSGTCSIGAVSTSRTWYLAEGYTDQGFEEWVLVQNPQPAYNNVSVVFMEKSGKNTVKQYRVPPESRFTILVDAYLKASEVSVKVRSELPVLVERAMYWNNRSDGHACIGTPTPDPDWYLAEGYTDQGFETWVLVQNPGDDPRRVTMTFMEPGGRNTVRTYDVAPRSRFTVGIDQILPASEVSTRVSADGPVIVERAIYFNGRSGGTSSLGIRGF